MTGDLVPLEEWFLSRGLPTFTRRTMPHSPRRLAAFLVTLALAETVLLAPSPSRPLLLDSLLILTSAVSMLLALLVALRAEERAASFTPLRFSLEAAFLALPALAALALASSRHAALIGALNVVVLVLVFLEHRWRYLAVIRWCATHAISQVRAATRYLSRSLPLLTVLVLSLFYTTEVWQASAAMGSRNLLAVVALLSLAGVLFSVVQARSGISRELRDGDSAARLSGTPAAALEPATGPATPLQPAEEANVTVLLLVSQLCVVLVTALVFALLILLLGALAISPSVVESWTGHAPVVLLSFDTPLRFCVSLELLSFATLMAGVAGLVFAVSLAGDQAFQDLTTDRLAAALLPALAAREVYLAALGPPSGERKRPGSPRG